MLQRTLLLALMSMLGAVAAVVSIRLIGVRVIDPAWHTPVIVAATVTAGLTGCVLAMLCQRSPRPATADVGAVAAGVLLAALSAAALNGTRWGWYGLHADSSFRTQMATRYADHVGLVDYGYHDLPAYYPPAVGWLQGRLAAATGLAGWESVKPVQLLLAALVPVLAYVLWRQLVRPPLAAVVAGLTAAWTFDPQKPDEWLVMACLVPWWVLAVRDVRAPGVDRWPAWRLGVVLGLLLLTHTYHFLPLGVATVLALGYDAVRGRTRLPWKRALAIGAVGLLVASPYWLGALVARLRLPTDTLQLRYTYPGANALPLPVPGDALGVVAALGLVWLLIAAWHWLRFRKTGDADGAGELPGALALALAGSCATLGIGTLGVRLDVGMLAFKTTDLVTALLLTCGVIAVARLLDRLPRRPRWNSAAITVTVTVAALLTGHHVASVWATGTPALVAQTTPYPDGSTPHGAGEERYDATLFVEPADPSVAEIRDSWKAMRPDKPLDEAVLVTSRVDLLATTPVYGFVAFKSIYSHPNGQFRDRMDLLRQVAACPTSSCAATLLRDNEYDAVDGLVLERNGDHLTFPVMADDFPNETRREEVAFPASVFRGDEFLRRDLGELTVVARQP